MLKHVTIGIRVMLGDGRSVGRNEQAVDRFGFSNCYQYPLEQSLERLSFDNAIGQSPGCEDWNGLEASFRQALKEPAYFMVGAGKRIANGLAFEQHIFFELPHPSRAGQEGIRFLQKGDDSNTHGEAYR